MKTIKLCALILTVCCFSVSCKKETEIKGDVFIVTAGAGNYKLGLVQVLAFPEDKLKTDIESKKSELATLSNQFEKAMADTQLYLGQSRAARNARELGLKSKFEADSSIGQAEQSNKESARINAQIEAVYQDFYSKLPPPSATATTDADGKFTMKLPQTGKYVLIARATRKVSDGDEKYSWITYFDADGTPKNIILSNNNTTDSGAKDSVFATGM